MVLNTMIVLVVAELLAAAAYAVVGPAARRQSALQRGGAAQASRSSYYRTVPWATEYWSEFERARRNRYRPFYIWRMRPFSGRLVRIDSAGLRETPGARCTSDAYRVFVFGGSTVWGLGAPDDATIPAHLQSILATLLRDPVCVRNYGQLGFTTSQDLVQLESELRAGNVPDLAIFYGGANDVFTTNISGQTGVHFDLWEISRAFETMHRPQGRAGFIGFLKGTNLYRLADALATAGPAGRTSERPIPRRSDSLADAVVTTFVSNHRQAAILARGYNFKVGFFWQPTVTAGAKPLNVEERRSLERTRVMEFATRVHQRAKLRLTEGEPGVYSLLDVFADDSGLVYVDSHHLTPEANRTVAQAIVQRIRTAIPEERLSGRAKPVSDRGPVGSPGTR
jgi:lysophospholipase L1-like esterase